MRVGLAAGVWIHGQIACDQKTRLSSSQVPGWVLAGYKALLDVDVFERQAQGRQQSRLGVAIQLLVDTDWGSESTGSE